MRHAANKIVYEFFTPATIYRAQAPDVWAQITEERADSRAEAYISTGIKGSWSSGVLSLLVLLTMAIKSGAVP
jgi:hypothetical protein